MNGQIAEPDRENDAVFRKGRASLKVIRAAANRRTLAIMKKQAKMALLSKAVLFFLASILAYYAFSVSEDTYH